MAAGPASEPAGTRTVDTRPWRPRVNILCGAARGVRAAEVDRGAWMTGFGRDAFSDAEHQATLGWRTTLVTPDGVSWLLNPGGPWLRWAGPNGWLPTPPPMDPGLRLGARRVPPPTPPMPQRPPMP